jgi:hypothetical protein
MPIKNPDTGQANVDQIEFLTPMAFELALEGLVEHFVADFRALAKVPKPAATDPSEREVFEKSVLYNLLDEWTGLLAEEHVLEGLVLPPDIVDLFDKTERDAVALQQQLEKLHSNLEDKITLHSAEKTTLAFATDAMSMIIIKGIDSVRQSLDLRDDSALGKRCGRPPASASLECLVAEMERIALTLGGKGFGTPTTQPKKGRIIQILDRLRKHLIDDPRLTWLTDFLPAPGTHPISVYQRAIKEGRAEYAKDLERAPGVTASPREPSEKCES